MGAAIAYYTALSVAPLLLIVIAIAGAVFGRDAAQGAIVAELQDLIGPTGAKGIQLVLANARGVGGGVLSIVTGTVILLLGATTVFGELQTDLDLIWETTATTRNGLLKLLRARLLSFGLLLGVGFLLMVSLLISTAISSASEFFDHVLANQAHILAVVNFFISFAIITVLFALIFKFLPSCPVAWGDVWMGAAVTSLLFSAGKYLIGLYLGRSSVSSSFGAAGAFVVVIVWTYYAAQIFLFGAEFTFQYACLHGSLRGATKSKRPASVTRTI